MAREKINQIFITGVAGFIGYHTAKRFLENNFYVFGVDTVNNHYDPVIKIKRLDDLKKNYKDRFIFKKVDISDKNSVEKLLKQKFSLIINLAANAGVRISVINPWIYYKTNTIGVLNILEGIKKYQPETLLIQASTSAVYGNNRVPFSENDRVDYPLSPYASSKKASEEICYTYHYLYGINTLIFRFFTVYGTFGRPDMSIFRFIKWIAEDEDVIVYGDGEQQRDFTYIEDIVEALFKSINFRGYDIINLGNNRPVKINYVIKTIEKLLKKKAKIKNLPKDKSDIFRSCASIKKAKKLLNWTPTKEIEEGLQITVDWYLKERSWAKKLKLEEKID